MVVIGKTNEKSTQGEKKMFNHFEKFEDSYPNYYFCYQPKIIDRYPDFIIIGKDIGVVSHLGHKKAAASFTWTFSNLVSFTDSAKYFLSSILTFSKEF
ncbi:MAG: hypothetical protein ACW967_07075 [Candidatus Hodarchaeales archaeon]